MALVNCPECKGKLSTTAPTCPHCGFRPAPSQRRSHGARARRVADQDRFESGCATSVITVLITFVVVIVVSFLHRTGGFALAGALLALGVFGVFSARGRAVMGGLFKGKGWGVLVSLGLIAVSALGFAFTTAGVTAGEFDSAQQAGQYLELARQMETSGDYSGACQQYTAVENLRALKPEERSSFLNAARALARQAETAKQWSLVIHANRILVRLDPAASADAKTAIASATLEKARADFDGALKESAAALDRGEPEKAATEAARATKALTEIAPRVDDAERDVRAEAAAAASAKALNEVVRALRVRARDLGTQGAVKKQLDVLRRAVKILTSLGNDAGDAHPELSGARDEFTAAVMTQVRGKIASLEAASRSKTWSSALSAGQAAAALIEELKIVGANADAYRMAELKVTRLVAEATVKDAAAKKEAAEQLRKRGPKPQSSGWDGSVRPVVQHLESNLRDPDSVEYIEWSPVIGRGDFWLVRVKYRAKNGFGGYVVANQVALIQHGQVVSLTDFRK